METLVIFWKKVADPDYFWTSVTLQSHDVVFQRPL